MRQITNKEFNEALQDKDNIRIIKYVCNQFSNKLSQDILHCCGQRGLWQCLKWHDFTLKNKKFTSSLYNTVKLECFKELNQIKTKKYKYKNTYNIEGGLSNESIDGIKIVRNRRDTLRKDKVIDNIVSPSNNLIDIQNKLEIEDLLKILSERDRNIIKDRYILGMKLKEIASKYNCSRQLVSKIIYNSLTLIKEKFGVSTK